jgi:hypothetical protein
MHFDPEDEPRIALPADPLARFAFLKAMAHFEGAWKTCASGECRNRKRCAGGPRGTFTRTGGAPLCRFGVENMDWQHQAPPLR